MVTSNNPIFFGAGDRKLTRFRSVGDREQEGFSAVGYYIGN